MKQFRIIVLSLSTLNLIGCEQAFVISKSNDAASGQSIPVYSREGIDQIGLPGFVKQEPTGGDSLGDTNQVDDVVDDEVDVLNPTTNTGNVCSGIATLKSQALSQLPALSNNTNIQRGGAQIPDGYACPDGLPDYYSSGYGACSNAIGSCWNTKGSAGLDGRTFGWPGWRVGCPEAVAESALGEVSDKVRFRYVNQSGVTLSEGMASIGLQDHGGMLQFHGLPALLASHLNGQEPTEGYIHLCTNSNSSCVLSSGDRVLSLRVNAETLSSRSNGLKQIDLASRILDQGAYSSSGAYCHVDFNEANSPLVLDVGQGIVLSDPRVRSVNFDLEGLGKKVAVSCLEQGAYLALPAAGSLIQGIHQLFGNNTRGPDGKTSENGFLALAKHDTNYDGRITRHDRVFSNLRLWQDKNCNGLSDAGELSSLDSKQIIEIDLDYVDSLEIDAYGNQTRERSVFETQNGKLGLIVDIWLAPKH